MLVLPHHAKGVTWRIARFTRGKRAPYHGYTLDIRPKELVLHDKTNLRKPHSHWDLKRDGHQVVSLSADNAGLGKFANLQGLADFLGWQ